MAEDISGPTGPVNLPVLEQIRDLLLDEEPLVETARFDDPVNPTELIVCLSVGRDSSSRLEITWWTGGAYRFHYTEPGGIDLRFDNHPKDGAPDVHFHPPPNAGEAKPSFLAGVTQPQIVTRAILSRWRKAIVEGQELSELNSS